MDPPLRTKEEGRELVRRLFQQRRGELPEGMKNEVKKTFERWITDDAIDGLTY